MPPSSPGTAAGGARPSATPPGGTGRPPGAGGRVGPPRSGGSAVAWVGGLVAGLIGGALAWLILGWVLPSPLQPELQLLQIRVDEIGEALTGAESGNTQLAQLATRVEALESGADTGLLGRIDALEAQVDQVQDLSARIGQLESAGGASLPPDLEERLAAIEAAGQQQAGVIQRLAEAEQPPADELVARIDALEETLQTGGQAGGAASAEFDQRLAALEADLAALAAGGGDGQASAEASATMSQIREQLNALQSEVGTLRSEGTADRLAALDQRLTSAEDSGAAVTALQGTVDQLQSQLQELAGRIPDDLGSTIENVANDLSGVEDRVQTLADTMASVQQQVGTVGEQVNELQARVGSTEEALETAANRRDQAAALALATAQIDAALEQAVPFERPLQTIQALAAEDQVVADASSALQPMAATGVPTLDQLRNDFEQIAGDIVHSSRSDGDGILDQAASNLMSLVTVRPVGAEAEGDDAAARVARAEAKLETGDLEGAIAELSALEGPAEAAARAWLEQARARLAAEQAVATLQNHATGLLGQTN